MGVADSNGREEHFPDEGSSVCPPGESMIFHPKETENIGVSGQTWSAQEVRGPRPELGSVLKPLGSRPDGGADGLLV